MNTIDFVCRNAGLLGPIRANSRSKSWNALIEVTTTTRKMLGVSIGTVTEMNCLHCPAPSSCAASYSSVGMFCRPADRMIRLKPRRSEEHTSELQSRGHLVCRLLLEKKKQN